MRTADQLLSSRRLAREDTLQSNRLVIFGHTAFETPLVMPDRICVDTGAVYGNMLTALELPALRFHHA
jgi:serine/threonine protein phosphatase 1